MDAMIQSDREFSGSKLRHRIRHVWFLFFGDGFFSSLFRLYSSYFSGYSAHFVKNMPDFVSDTSLFNTVKLF